MSEKSPRQTTRTDQALSPDVTLDARGLRCPLPVLKANKAITTVPLAGVLEVLATDTGAKEDFEAFCSAGGHELLACTETDGVCRFLIRRMR